MLNHLKANNDVVLLGNRIANQDKQLVPNSLQAYSR